MNDNLHFVYIIILIIIYFNNRICKLENNSIEKFANTCNDDVTLSKGLSVTNTLNAKGNLSVDGTILANGGAVVNGQIIAKSATGNNIELQGGDLTLLKQING